MMLLLRFLAFPLLCACSLVSVALSAPVLNVVLTGDSITGGSVGYADEFSGLHGTSTFVGRPGLDSENYIYERDADGKNYAEQVVDLNPDVIVFMLGINDATTSAVDGEYFEFRRRLDTAFDIFDSSTASRVILLSILPVDESNLSWAGGGVPGTNARVNGVGGIDPDDVSFGYNPWLEREAGRRNADANASPTYEYVDLNSGFNLSLLDTDGIHLTDLDPNNDPFGTGLGTSGAGQQWLAAQVSANITSVPEPSAFLAVGCVFLIALVVNRQFCAA